MKNKNEVVLEPSTNTHKLVSNGNIKVKELAKGILKLTIPSNDGIVTHGEHGTIRTESSNVIKYVQQELNPVTQKLQNAFD
jgi:hypothetical protein